MLQHHHHPDREPVKGRPVDERIKASAATLLKRRDRERLRSSYNMVGAPERLDRATAIFLRLAVLVSVKPTKRSPLHHRQIHESKYGVRVTAAEVYHVATELYGRGPTGLNPAQPALDLLSILAGGEPIPSITPRSVFVAYRMARGMAEQARRQVARAGFDQAFRAAKSSVGSFFAWLMPARA